MEINLRIKVQEGTPLVISYDSLKTGFPGLSIPHIFNLGPKFEYEIGVLIDINKDLDITFGAIATLPNEALMKGSITDSSQNEVSS